MRHSQLTQLEIVIMSHYVDNMIRTQVSFDSDVYAEAKKLARRQGISLAELCRRAVGEVLARQSSDKPWMAYAGILDGNQDDSESVDEVVYGRIDP